MKTIEEIKSIIIESTVSEINNSKDTIPFNCMKCGIIIHGIKNSILLTEDIALDCIHQILNRLQIDIDITKKFLLDPPKDCNTISTIVESSEKMISNFIDTKHIDKIGIQKLKEYLDLNQTEKIILITNFISKL